jgi:hypothetical protein
MHRDMKAELEGQIDGNLNEHQRVFDKWRKEFNTVRPHAALDMKTPSEIYHKSERKYDSKDILIVYGRGYKSRMVNDRGFCNYKRKRIFIGNPFSGYNIAIKEIDGVIKFWFDDFFIGTLDQKTGLLLPQTDITKVAKSG